MSYKQKVLITGCSDGGLGAALAIAFHEAGLEVYATARDPSKMAGVVAAAAASSSSSSSAQGIKTLRLDVQSDSSIAECVSEVPELDILVNNAGGNYKLPVSDMSIPEAKKLFDLNVWSCLAVTQAFLPALLKSSKGGMIVNHTSCASLCPLPFQAAYNASKAALGAFSDTQRLELKPFGIRVVDLKSGFVKSNILKNALGEGVSLPDDSIYAEAREVVERAIQGDTSQDSMMPSDEWAKAVVSDLLHSNRSIVWRGSQAWAVQFGSMLPFGALDSTINNLVGMNEIEQLVRKSDV